MCVHREIYPYRIRGDMTDERDVLTLFLARVITSIFIKHPNRCKDDGG